MQQIVTEMLNQNMVEIPRDAIVEGKQGLALLLTRLGVLAINGHFPTEFYVSTLVVIWQTFGNILTNTG